jgi:GNAT superfamily N-acetyltransferase
MDVREADTDWELDQVRRLFRALVAWQRERHLGDLGPIGAYVDEGAWERELAGLPGDYAPPEGRLLVCWDAELAVGCVAVKRLNAESCEMKRLFVVQMARGRGAGRALAEAALSGAREAGYSSMYLDTSVRQTEAITLYRELGFAPVEPYRDLPEEMLGWLAFFRLAL